MASTPESARRARNAYLLLALLILAYIAAYGWLSIHLHNTLITSADDLSNVDQVVWNSQHGRLLERTTGTRSVPRYGEHVEPIWIALGLLYFGWDDVRALLLAQTVALALGALPLFWFARDAWARDKPAYGAGLLFAALYLLNPFVSRANVAEVHATPFVVAPMLLALYYGWRGRWARVAPLALLVLLVREDTGLLLVAFGLWTLARVWLNRGDQPRARNVKAGLALAAAGVGGVLFMLFGIIRTFADERFSGASDSVFFERYRAFGDSPAAIVVGIFTRGDLWAELLRDGYRLDFLRDFVLATGGLGLFAPLAWLLFAPHFLLNFFSNYFAQYGSLQHYGAPLVPGMMVAAVLGGAWLLRLGRYHPAWRMALMAIALGGALATALSATGQPLAADWILPVETAHHRLLTPLIAQIPPRAPLSADPQLHPHLAHRPDAYRFPVVGDNAEWIVLDVTTNSTRHPADLKRDVDELLAGGWGVANARDGYLLLQKGNPNRAIPSDFYTFATNASDSIETNLNAQFGDALRVEGYTLHQDFWGRVAVEWRVTPLRPLSEGISVEGALLLPDGTPITDTVGQPMTALVWLPVSAWEAGQTYTLRTLPRHSAPYFYPALTVREGDTALPVAPAPEGARADVRLRAQNGWLVAGEWRLSNNHTLRGSDGWRLFDAPAPSASTVGAWVAGVELVAWQMEEQEETLVFTLTWRATGGALPPLQRFVHLVPATGAPVPIAQADAVLGGDYPATEWAAGEYVQETIALPPPPEGSAWRLLVGLYDPATGARYPVTPDAGDQTFELSPR